MYYYWFDTAVSVCLSIVGNDNIYRISTSARHMLSIHMEDFSGNFAYAKYSVFDIGEEQRKYILRIVGYSGDGDGLSM